MIKHHSDMFVLGLLDGYILSKKNTKDIRKLRQFIAKALKEVP